MKRILVVEERTPSASCGDQLQRAGYDVVEANSGGSCAAKV